MEYLIWLSMKTKSGLITQLIQITRVITFKTFFNLGTLDCLKKRFRETVIVTVRVNFYFTLIKLLITRIMLASGQHNLGLCGDPVFGIWPSFWAFSPSKGGGGRTNTQTKNIY